MMGGFSVAWLALLWIANYFEDQGYAVVSIKKEQHSLIESFLKKKEKKLTLKKNFIVALCGWRSSPTPTLQSYVYQESTHKLIILSAFEDEKLS